MKEAPASVAATLLHRSVTAKVPPVVISLADSLNYCVALLLEEQMLFSTFLPPVLKANSTNLD